MRNIDLRREIARRKSDDTIEVDGVLYMGGKPTPNWTDDIADAWGLVEEMRLNWFDVTITLRPGWESGCRVAPRGEFNTSNIIFVTGEPPALAISRAWVKWDDWMKNHGKERKT